MSNAQTVDPNGCTCGAAEFGRPDVPHKEVHCYISLAKDAEAVVDAPVRDLGASSQRRPTPMPTAGDRENFPTS